MTPELPPQLSARLAPIGIDVEPLLTQRIRELVGADLRDLLPPRVDAVTACRAWGQFLENRSRIPDDEEWDRAVVLLLAAFTLVFDGRQAWRKAVERELARYRSKAGRPLTTGGTWFEARRTLAARLFHFGRRGTITPPKQAALAACISDYDFLLASDIRASTPAYRARYVGMRGTASLFLARTAENPLEHYERAAVDLEESGPLGDRSHQRSEYLVEAHLHRYELTKDPAILSAAEAALHEPTQRGDSTRALSTLAGMTNLARAALAIEADDRGSAEQFAHLASQHLRSALQQPEHQAFTSDYIRLNYGIALGRRAMATDDVAVAEELLDEAIRELLIVERDAGETYPNLWLPGALAHRAELRLRNGLHEAALSDAEAAISRAAMSPAKGAAELGRRAELAASAARLHLAIGRGIADDIERAFDWWPATWKDSTWLPVPVLVAAVRWLGNANRPGWRDRASSVRDMVRTMTEQERCAPSARRFALGHAGSLLLSVAKADGDPDTYRDAYALYIDAIDADAELPAPELYGHAGEIALRLARVEAVGGKNEAAIAMLQDATNFMRAAFERHQLGIVFSEKTPVVAVHGRAGEAFARLHGYTGDEAHAAEAIYHLESARALGNSSAPLLGLLGDVYFRRGRARRNLSDLRVAVSLKSQARAGDDADDVAGWRENLSVTANASMLIWSITREPADLLIAVRAAAEAAEEDPHWAWPLLQLAEIAEYPRPDRELARALAAAECDELTRLALEGNSTSLIERACHVAVANRTGFGRDAKFAGRQYVYTLADPHRLLNTTLIIKETPKENAIREMRTITDFRDYLVATHAPIWMKLPEPMALVESGEHAAYVMRRAPGGELGAVAVRMLWNGREAHDLIVRAAQFLARYHVWRGVTPPSARQNELPRAIGKGVRAYGNYCALTEAGQRELAATLNRLSSAALPLVAKKDAHAENWLVTPQNEIVMLDLEAKETTRLPFLYELVQLIEDHGLVEPSAAGWNSRMGLVASYRHEVATLLQRDVLAAFDHTALERLYAAFALVRAVILLPGTDRRSVRRRSESSVMRAKSHRADHYRKIVALIRDRFAGTDAGKAAETMTLQF